MSAEQGQNSENSAESPADQQPSQSLINHLISLKGVPMTRKEIEETLFAAVREVEFVRNANGDLVADTSFDVFRIYRNISGFQAVAVKVANRGEDEEGEKVLFIGFNEDAAVACVLAHCMKHVAETLLDVTWVPGASEAPGFQGY